MIVPGIVAQHWDDAAFLWTQRDRAAASPRYTLRELARLDERLDAHVDGLRISGDEGWALGQAQLGDLESGVLFPLAITAFESGDRGRMRDVVVAGCAAPAARRTLVSALGWLDWTSVEPWIGRLLSASVPAQRLIGVAACAVRRFDPGDALGALLTDDDPEVRARAVRAVGELGRRDLIGRVGQLRADAHDATRYWSAWTLTRFSEPDGLRALVPWIDSTHPWGAAAADLAARAMTAKDARELVRRLASQPETTVRAMRAAAALGDPSCIPWLIGHMGDPELSRAAGLALSLIAGVDLEASDLVASPVLPSAEDDAEAEDANATDGAEPAPPPNQELVRDWWARHEGDFQVGRRYLAGRVLDAASAHVVLALGSQRQRAAAALERALRAPDDPMFEVRQRGADQQHVLAAPVS